MTQKFIKAVTEKLRERGYKLTGPRLAVIDYLAREKRHPGLQKIYKGILVEHPGIGIATVYRTIDLLIAVGVLRELNLRNSQLRYELNYADHHHYLICTSCGKVNEFDNCNFQLIAGELEEQTHFKIEEHTLEAYGLCAHCLHD